ncbi:MAG: hypothetical protein PHW69_00905 [Elusimicrobiaceae bacterium]|nr:hypothetical protein [Elusimicrobiaceae bacterium]
MKRFFLAAACAAGLLCGPCAAQQGVALLWIPEPGSDILPVLSETGANPDFKFTVAIAPENVTEQVKPRLQQLETDGRAETALRIVGDPPLPLLFSPQSAEVVWPGKTDKKLWSTRLDELASCIFKERNLFEKKFVSEPLGWVPQAGGITPEMISLTKAYSMKWLAAGPNGAGGNTVYGDDDISVVSFSRIASTAAFAELLGGRETDFVFAVIDETLPRGGDEPDPRQTLLSLIRESTATPNWQTVSQALAGDIYKASLDPESSSYQPWTGDYALWAGSARQQGALRSLDEARRNYGIFINSGSNTRAAAALQREFDEIQSSSNLLVLGSTVPETGNAAEETFKTRLKSIYRKMNRPIPPTLSQPLSASDAASADLSAAAPQSASMKSGPGWLKIDNPAEQLKLPETLAKMKNLSAEAFSVASLQAEWTDSTITFTVKSESGADFKNLFLADLYIDQNHRARSGLTELLDGRGGLRTSPEDAWEFAFSVYGGGARFYQATPDKALFLRSYPVRQKNGSLSFEVPRTDLRGNPENWGYCLLVMAYDSTANDLYYPLQFDDKTAVIDTVALDRLGSTLYFFRLPKKY